MTRYVLCTGPARTARGTGAEDALPRPLPSAMVAGQVTRDVVSYAHFGKLGHVAQDASALAAEPEPHREHMARAALGRLRTPPTRPRPPRRSAALCSARRAPASPPASPRVGAARPRRRRRALFARADQRGRPACSRSAGAPAPSLPTALDRRHPSARARSEERARHAGQERRVQLHAEHAPQGRGWPRRAPEHVAPPGETLRGQPR